MKPSGPSEPKSMSEYVRDLIRKDKAAGEDAAFERVKATLQAAFAEPSENYHPLTLEGVLARARAERN